MLGDPIVIGGAPIHNPEKLNVYILTKCSLKNSFVSDRMGRLQIGSPLSIRNSEGAWPIVAVLTWNLSVSTSSAQRVQFVTLKDSIVER